VILGDNFHSEKLNDSKKLSASMREELRVQICDNALAWGIGWASHEEIDKINILQAALLAMRRAFDEMIKYAGKKQTLPQNAIINAIVDGNKVPDLNLVHKRVRTEDTEDTEGKREEKIITCTAMVKADAKVPEVMAASILAKTARDEYMDEMAKLYPQYGYAKHKGYPTKAHREAVLKYGPSPIQRLSFTVR
jgi:ribonuclease HII